MKREIDMKNIDDIIWNDVKELPTEWGDNYLIKTTAENGFYGCHSIYKGV